MRSWEHNANDVSRQQWRTGEVLVRWLTDALAWGERPLEPGASPCTQTIHAGPLDLA